MNKSKKSQIGPENDEDRRPSIQKTYLGICLDPVHIGTGGYRLGRVDNTIARDPATNLPIIYGSSIEGTARTYSAYRLIEDDESIKAEKNNESEYLNCAAKSMEEKTEKRVQCGKCEICISYGFSRRERSLHGMAQFSDAKILFFPVHTLVGPVWVTSPQILRELFPGINMNLESKLSTTENGKIEEKALICVALENGNLSKVNLGWLYLETTSHNNMKPEEWTLNPQTPEKCKLGEVPKMAKILNRLVIVSDRLFSQVVNSNLEVRTSVSIDPRTGAAEEGALFTYEAIPRGTVMHFNVTFLNPKNFQILKNNSEKSSILGNLENMVTIKDTVKKGLELFEFLGVGGMGTRGFGRFKILNP